MKFILLVQNFFVLLYKITAMNINEQNDIDFPLSGGDEPDMKFNTKTILLITIGIIVASLLMVYFSHH